MTAAWLGTRDGQFGAPSGPAQDRLHRVAELDLHRCDQAGGSVIPTSGAATESGYCEEPSVRGVIHQELAAEAWPTLLPDASTYGRLAAQQPTASRSLRQA